MRSVSGGTFSGSERLLEPAADLGDVGHGRAGHRGAEGAAEDQQHRRDEDDRGRAGALHDHREQDPADGEDDPDQGGRIHGSALLSAREGHDGGAAAPSARGVGGVARQVLAAVHLVAGGEDRGPVLPDLGEHLVDGLP